MARHFMKENRGRRPVRETVGLLGVGGGARYRRAKQGVSERWGKAGAELARLIREIVANHRRRYGGPRAREASRRDYGRRVSLKKAVRLMREHGLNARKRRKFIPTANSKHGLPVCESILSRFFHAGRGGGKRVSDITRPRAAGGRAYLTVTLERYDRSVIGWALSADRETAHTTIPALDMAYGSRKAREGMIFHSDRGARHCAKLFRERLREQRPPVLQSVSRKGNCWDNACAETFFKTLKRGLESLEGKHSAAAVRQSVFMCLEAYYNRLRIHSALDYGPLMCLTQGVSLNRVYLMG
ncbi:MAG: IS3 family transposase [Treponema sp.]|jgi:transposase InsO family protein|nr:IS3 family transposase [Treponema sp.]